ncbi:MAG: hypothetical protein ACI4TI_02035, partial [Christensenellales bacterium]
QSKNINPSVYPVGSLNTKISYKIENKTSVDDIIKFENGIITPIKAGECDLVLIPNGCIKETGDYENAKRIRVIVADGDEVPYSISSKQELLMLCKETLTENETEFVKRFSKNYVLTNDIDLSGESIVPIGVYRLKTQSGEETKKCAFTGTFSGMFKVGEVEKNFSVSGINLKIDNKTKSSFMSNKLYLGLFAENKGSISNLTVHYSNVDAMISRYADPLTYADNNLKNMLIFGGICAINAGKIENCEVRINACYVETYFGENLIGGICGLNGDRLGGNSILSEVVDCFVSGNINVVDGYRINSKTLQKYPKIIAGGIVAQNLQNNKILGTFDIYSNKTEIFNKNIINSTINLSSIYDGSLLQLNTDSCFGGIVGKNEGIVENMASYGKIYAFANVGGICGVNESTGIVGGNDVLGTQKGCFSASLVFGNTCVGGLVGKNDGRLIYNAVMLLDDAEFVEGEFGKAKIFGSSFVAGLAGSCVSKDLLENNFVRSYVQKQEKYFDIYASSGNFGAIFWGDGVADYENAVVGTNFADNLKIGFINSTGTQETVQAKGNSDNIGISAPESIEVSILDSTLSESTLYSYNKFIKADDKTIVLYYYSDSEDFKYNYYLRNYLFKISYLPQTSDITLTKIESLNPDVVFVDNKGNFEVQRAGEAKIKIYSALNKQAQQEIVIKVVDVIDKFVVFEDALENSKINTLYVEKDTSKNIYFASNILQKDVFVKFEISQSSVVEINLDLSEYYSVLNAQV